MASTRSCDVEDSNSARSISVAAATCSQLSTSNQCGPSDSASRNAVRSRASGTRVSESAKSRKTFSPEVAVARSTKTAGGRESAAAATCSARRVLPAPAGPVNVTMRWADTRRASSSISRSRPINVDTGRGSEERSRERSRSRAPVSTNVWRSGAPSLPSREDTWLSTVRADTCKRSAISLLCSRSATIQKISSSRRVTPAARSCSGTISSFGPTTGIMVRTTEVNFRAQH